MKTLRLVVVRFDPFSNLAIAEKHGSTADAPKNITDILVFTLLSDPT